MSAYNKEYQKKYRRKNLVKLRKYNRKYNKKWRKENGYESEKMYKKKYKFKVYAHQILGKLIKRKKVERGICQVCGIKNAQAHHVDYKKPLSIIWVCPLHHRNIHTGKISIKKLKIHDYSSVEKQFAYPHASVYNKTMPRIRESQKFGKLGGLKRWSSVSKKERSRIMREVALKRYAKEK